MIGYTFHGMNMSQLALWFFIYSFCGWAMECVVIRIQLGKQRICKASVLCHLRLWCVYCISFIPAD